MSFPEKSRSTKILGGQRDYTDPPHFPVDLSKTSIEDHKQAHALWWDKTKSNIMDLEQDVADLRAKINSS